ncbi:MAG: hypothetical protein NTX54_03770 [Chloroflexi bacterium]|nr:hypothetical protein [Chloroflexota bacterium]
MTLDDRTPDPSDPLRDGEANPEPLVAGFTMRQIANWAIGVLVTASVVVAFVGRHGGPVVLSALLALAALGIYLLASPDGDPADA